MVLLANKIGLVIRNPQSVFTNGCVQQAVFLKQLIVSLGFPCDYIGVEESFQTFPITHEPIKIVNKNTKLSNYKLFIFVSLHLNPQHDKDVIENIRRHNIKCVNLVCGNLYILHHEEFVFNKHNILYAHDSNTIYDEYWVLEMYPFITDYITLLTGKPAYLLPYIWNDTIIKMHTKTLNITTDYHEVSRNKINILIYEPNMSIHKTSFIPLLIAESYQKKYGEYLNKVFVFCGNRVLKEGNHEFVQRLDIYKTQKLEAYDRMIMPNTIALIKENNNYINVVISHNIMNSLNFLHLEMLTIDIPIIHNCEPFKDNQLYYDDYSSSKAMDLVEWVRTDFYLNSDYRSNAFNIKNKFHPHKYERQEVYKAHIERITNVYVRDDKASTLGVTLPLVENIVRMIEVIHKQPSFDNMLFYSGEGLTILLSTQDEYNSLKVTLNNLKNINNVLPVEIVYHDLITPTNEVKSNILTNLVLPFKVVTLNLADNDAKLVNEPNVYMGIVFSNFEKGILMQPGTRFLSKNTPNMLIDAHINEQTNSLMYYPSYEKISYLDKLDKSIHENICKDLKLEPLNKHNEYINTSGVIYYNKRDVNCLKVLGTMCELVKLNKHVSINVNLVDVVCRLTYGNNNSKISKQCNIYGYMENTFNGLGTYYNDPETKEIDICISRCDFPSKDKKLITINCIEHNLKIKKENSTSHLKFSGKFPAKNLPKKLTCVVWDFL